MNHSLASTINPSAGSHVISSDPREIEAARRASERSRSELPYLQERYGERGQRFCDSDGSWLALVCRGERPYVERQVLWLGNILSSRGMPRWLLARHLQVLHLELVHACPENAARYDHLHAAAEMLLHRQEQYLSGAVVQELADSFGNEADPAWVARIPEMGRILVAAVADEADGIRNAVTSVTSWAADPSHFPREWCRAVQGTVRRSRGRLRSRQEGGLREDRPSEPG
jgi:hypothetical protein